MFRLYTANNKPDSVCFNVTLRRARTTIVAVEYQ